MFSRILPVLFLLACSHPTHHTENHSVQKAATVTPSSKTAGLPPGVAPAYIVTDSGITRRSRKHDYYKQSDAFFGKVFKGRSPASVSKSEIHDLVDAKLGKFEVTMEHAKKVKAEPYRLKVFADCNDLRSGHHAFKPKPEMLIKDEHGNDGITICDFVSHEYGLESKTLTLNYMRSSDGKPKHCDTEWKQTFDMKQICAAWNE